MAEKFYTILTNVGKAAVANASAIGNKVDFKYMAIGDGGGGYYNPTEIQTQLVNEVYRGQINHIQLDDENLNWITLSMVIPPNIGGFTVREVGLFDSDNNLLAVGKHSALYKPKPEDGSITDLTINIILEVSNTSVVTIKVDPSVILATKKYVDNLAGVGRTTETVKGNADNITDIKNELGSYKAEIENLIKIKKNVTITSANWNKVGELYQYNILDTDITEDTVVDVNIHLTDLEKANDIKSANLSSLGKVTLYADDKPTENIKCDIKIIRQVV